MTHYDVLGVTRDAPTADIRRAYLALARIHHPDFHTDDDASTRSAHARNMQSVNEAWKVLGEPSSRAAYDLGLADGARASTAGRDSTVPPGKGWTPRAGDTHWMDDFDGWRAEDGRLPEDVLAPTTGRRALFALPSLLLVLAVILVFLGVVLTARPLIAGALIALFLSAGLFIFLPMLEMSKGRDDE